MGDLAALVALVQRQGVPLLLDEAHGAHLGLDPRLPPSGLSAGADLVVQSLQKAAGGLLEGLHHQIGSSAQARGRQARVQPQMGAVGFIEQQRHSLPLDQRHQRRKIAHTALVTR